MIGLVLTAGGARGAYQAGVLKRLGEVPAFADRPSPFPIVAGASAGAINGTLIAAGSGDFSAATRRLADLWANLQVHDVFRTDLLALGMGAARWLRDLSLGGMLGGGGASALLDATPLEALLNASPPPRRHPRRDRTTGHLFAVAIAATSYHSGRSFIFVRGTAGAPGVDEEPARGAAGQSSPSTTCARRRRSRSSFRRSPSARPAPRSTSATAGSAR